MFPWLWIFAPQTWLPLSGAVTQDLSPEAFFRGIRPGAGVPGIEQRVFEQASYGKQLGWLIDVMVDAIDDEVVRSSAAREALHNIKNLHAQIARIKAEHRQDRAAAAIALLDQIQADNPEELQRLLLRYQAGRVPT